MNPRAISRFLATPSGRLIGFVALVFLALVLARGCRREAAVQPPVLEPRSTNAPIVDTARQPLSPIGPATLPVVTNQATNLALPPLTWYADWKAEPELSANYAPYGSIIPICLVQAVESDDAETPIIALTTEDLCHLGSVILPRDSMVHGRAQRGHSGDRIHSETSFTLVWPTGEQLAVSGLLLNQDRLPAGGWGPDDGIAGLKGRLVRSDSWADLKVFASTFLSGAAQALEQRQSTTFGTAVLPNAQNAALQGTSEVLNRYAAQVAERLQRDAYVVKVSAGKSAYLLVTQVVDRNQARAGSARSASVTTPTLRVP